MRASAMVDSDAWSPTTASTGSAGSNRLMTKVTTQQAKQRGGDRDRTRERFHARRCSCSRGREKQCRRRPMRLIERGRPGGDVSLTSSRRSCRGRDRRSGPTMKPSTFLRSGDGLDLLEHDDIRALVQRHLLQVHVHLRPAWRQSFSSRAASGRGFTLRRLPDDCAWRAAHSGSRRRWNAGPDSPSPTGRDRCRARWRDTWSASSCCRRP